MSRIVIVSKDTYECTDMLRAAEANDVDVRISNGADVKSVVLEDTEVVYWRSSCIKTQRERADQRTFLLDAFPHISIINEAIVKEPFIRSKKYQQEKFKGITPFLPNVCSIPTYVASDINALRELITSGTLHYPFIAKPDKGMRGNGIELISSEMELSVMATQITDMVFQNFIENQGDYRVLVVGGVAHDVMHRQASRSSKKPYINNISKGGTATSIPDDGKHELLSKVGSTIATAFGLTIAGVDLIEDTNGTLYFLEINTVPQWRGMNSISSKNVGEHVVETLNSLIEDQTLSLTERVQKHVLYKLPYLPVRKQFHFLSRLYLWTKDERYYEALSVLRPLWWKNFDRICTSLKSVHDTTFKYGEQSFSCKKYRRLTMKRFAAINCYNRFFFRCLFDRTIFKGDAFEIHRASINTHAHRMLYTELRTDLDSVLTLSTPAVNFLMLSDYFLKEEPSVTSPEYFLKVGDRPSTLTAHDSIDARIYLYTHAIIARTRFYLEAIPITELPYYLTMLRRVETLIRDNYESTSLDHKCEFLVCSTICGYTSLLSVRIHAELTISLSPHGAYFVNTHNSYAVPQTRKTLSVMEHTNVLALMAFSDREHITDDN